MFVRALPLLVLIETLLEIGFPEVERAQLAFEQERAVASGQVPGEEHVGEQERQERAAGHQGPWKRRARAVGHGDGF